MDTLLKDLAFGVRTLRKNPAFALTALVTLALGIGASTAIFSVVNAVLLRPLPYTNADRLTLITSDMKNRNVRDFPVAPGDLKDLRDQAKLFDGIAGVVTFRQSFSGDNAEPEQVRAAFATTNLFSLLGVRMAAGRDFSDEDGTPNPAPPPAAGGAGGAGGAAGANAPQANAPPPPPPLPTIAILSYGFWQRRYGGDRSIVGKSVDMGPNRAQIVGVAGPEFELLFPPRFNVERVPDVVTASRINLETASRINVVFRLVGRLKPGATVGAAQGQVDAIAADLRQRFPIKNTAGVFFRVEPMHKDLVADVRPAVLALMGAVAFVLLIACANVANLLLVRTSRRERELAVRAALGGSRARLVRQMLSESLVLSAGGAVLGLALAKLGVRVLVAIGPASLPRVSEVSLDPSVLAFTALACLMAAALFGIVPAVRASRANVIGVLRASGRTSELGAGRALRSAVVVAEVALAFVLLIGSGLMFRSFVTLANTDPGFDPRGVLTLSIQNARNRTPETRAAYAQALRQRLTAIPGVTAVTAASPMPLDGIEANARWGTESAVSDPAAFQQANVHTVLPGYFAALRTKILEGRDFSEADNVPAAKVLVIDNLLAAKAFPGQSAIGKQLFTRFRGNDPEWMDVIGVVQHQRHQGLATDGREAMYFSDGELGHGNATRWAVRTTGDPVRLSAAVRAEIAALDPLVPIAELVPMSDYVDKARAPTRFALILIGVFAGIAAVLSAVGLYGVLSTVVRQRTAEIGVRMALGAPTRQIFGLVIGQGLRLSVGGIGLGLAAALVLTRSMRSMLVGVAPTDPWTFVTMAVVFFAIAALACWIPARRAAGLDPAIALRDE